MYLGKILLVAVPIKPASLPTALPTSLLTNLPAAGRREFIGVGQPTNFPAAGPINTKPTSLQAALLTYFPTFFLPNNLSVAALIYRITFPANLTASWPVCLPINFPAFSQYVWVFIKLIQWNLTIHINPASLFKARILINSMHNI